MDVHLYQPFKSIFSYEEKSQRQVTWTADGNQVSETRHLKSLYRRNLDIFSEWLWVPGQCQSMSCRGMTVSWQWVKAIKLHGNECRSRRPVFCDQRRKIAKALFLVWWWSLLSVLWWFAFSVVFWCFALFVVVFDVLLSLLCFWRFAFFVGVFGVMLSFFVFFDVLFSLLLLVAQFTCFVLLSFNGSIALWSNIRWWHNGCDVFGCLHNVMDIRISSCII